MFQVVGGWFADRFGPRWTLTLCGIAWAVATIMTGLASGMHPERPFEMKAGGARPAPNPLQPAANV